MLITDSFNMNTGSSGMIFPIEEALDGDGGNPGERSRRMFLVGGPWGPMYPMGFAPADVIEEEEDPNP